MRVLIADDDPVIRMVLSAVIAREPALELVGEAEDADEAVRLAADAEPEVVLLDVDMPGGGGARAAGEIRHRRPGVRLVALSADDSEEARDAMAAAGAAAHVSKSAPPEAILRAIYGLS